MQQYENSFLVVYVALKTTQSHKKKADIEEYLLNQFMNRKLEQQKVICALRDRTLVTFEKKDGEVGCRRREGCF